MVVLLKSMLVKLVPVSFVVGGFMEFFMCKTGFYEITAGLEADKRAARAEEQYRQRQRMIELGIIDAPDVPSSTKG
jgi:hypothetical protein